jgi:CheY-like chemotaxis protein
MANELILIVEDNPKNLKLVRDTLQVKGYQTIEAEPGEEGVRIASGATTGARLNGHPATGYQWGRSAEAIAGRSGHKLHSGHRNYGLGDDPRPNSNHGRRV